VDVADVAVMAEAAAAAVVVVVVPATLKAPMTGALDCCKGTELSNP